MKTIPLILSLLFTAHVYGEVNYYKSTDIELKNGITYLKATEDRVSGIVKSYYTNGVHFSHIELENGVQHGKEIALELKKETEQYRWNDKYPETETKYITKWVELTCPTPVGSVGDGFTCRLTYNLGLR